MTVGARLDGHARDRISRAFDMASRRVAEAESAELTEDELSNLLHQFYRLVNVLEREYPTKRDFHEAMRTTPDRRLVRAVAWTRTFETHEAITPGQLGDAFSDVFHEMFGTIVWQPVDELSTEPDRNGYQADYSEHLEGRAVADTTRRAFDLALTMHPEPDG